MEALDPRLTRRSSQLEANQCPLQDPGKGGKPRPQGALRAGLQRGAENGRSSGAAGYQGTLTLEFYSPATLTPVFSPIK